jgi:hypothetical protein
MGWRRVRARFLNAGNDFCVICGRGSGRLEVHHVEGHRNTQWDDLATVVTVCPGHHRVLERYTTKIRAWSDASRRRAALVLLGVLGDRKCELAGARLLAKGDAQ